MQKSKYKMQNLGVASPQFDKQSVEEIAEEAEEQKMRDENKSPKMKVSGKKVFDLKKIIENEKNNRHSRTDRQR